MQDVPLRCTHAAQASHPPRSQLLADAAVGDGAASIMLLIHAIGAEAEAPK